MLRVDRLTKIYNNPHGSLAGGIRDAEFALEPGAFFTLLGPSGCGKTTTLRCIAGLEQPDSGRIALGDTVLYDAGADISVPMNRRNLGMVFQSYAIWPHMTVFENVAFPLQVAKDRRYARPETEAAVKRALRTVNLDGYQSRSATQLSGGEQQRVALARAIVRRPALLLLDEPLSNLDAQLREEMRTELKQLQREIGVATVYVTHDQTEALALSDRIAVINRGRMMQLGTPRDIYFRPETEFVARFIGASNIAHGTVDEPVQAGGTAAVSIPGPGVLHCVFARHVPRGSRVAVCVRPEKIAIAAGVAADSPAGANVITGRIRQTSFLGQATRCDVAFDGAVFQAIADPNAPFAPGDMVHISFPVEATLAVEPDAPEPASANAAAPERTRLA